MKDFFKFKPYKLTESFYANLSALFLAMSIITGPISIIFGLILFECYSVYLTEDDITIYLFSTIVLFAISLFLFVKTYKKYKKTEKQLIKTMRDAKRFVNMLRTDVLTIYSPDLDIEDFLLLELLKFHNTHVYETLYVFPMTYLVKSGYFTSRKDLVKDESVETVEKEILGAMFPRIRSYSDRPNRIRKPEMFSRYFVREDIVRERIKLYDLFDELITEQQVHGLMKKLSTRPEDTKELFESLDKYGRMYIDGQESLKRYIYIILCALSSLITSFKRGWNWAITLPSLSSILVTNMHAARIP